MRYQKQEILQQIGARQKLLESKSVSIVGLGATGSSVANLLARSGINLNLVDRDVVELDNLQRQFLYDEYDIGKPKAIQAKQKLNIINSDIRIKANVEDLNYSNISRILKSDLILDCTDNMDTRFLLNDFCLKNEIPWVYSAVLGVHGMTMNFIPGKTPCFRCLFRDQNSILENCESTGVLNSITNLIASIQATESIKILTNQEVNTSLILFNIWNLNLEKFTVNKNNNCTACNGNFEYLNGKGDKRILKYCGINSFQIYGQPIDLSDLFNRLKKTNDSILSDFCLYTEKFTAFKDGRVLIKADSVNQAKSIYSRYIGN